MSRSSDPFYIVTYYMKSGTTSWTDGIHSDFDEIPQDDYDNLSKCLLGHYSGEEGAFFLPTRNDLKNAPIVHRKILQV